MNKLISIPLFLLLALRLMASDQRGPSQPSYYPQEIQFTNTVVTGTNYIILGTNSTVTFSPAIAIPCGLQRNLGLQIDTWGNGASASNIVAVFAPSVGSVTYDTNRLSTFTVVENGTKTNCATTNFNADGLGWYWLLSLQNTGPATNTVKLLYGGKYLAP